MLFNDDGRICQSLFPMKLTISMPYVIVLTTGKSVSSKSDCYGFYSHVVREEFMITFLCKFNSSNVFYLFDFVVQGYVA